MVTYIGKPIMPKLLTRFGSQQGDDPKMILSNQVIPVVEIDPILKTTGGNETSGTAAQRADVYTVPTGKKWILRNIQMSRDTAGTINIYIVKPDGTDYQIYAAGTTTVAFVNLNNLYFVLSAGWQVSLSMGTATSGNIGTTVVYDEYDEN